MPITVSQTVWIEVAHRMNGHPIPQNDRVHGHSLRVTVTAAASGMDFHAFDAQVKIVAGLLDHRYLNDVKELGEPTLESVATFLGERIALVGPPGRIVSVAVERASLGQAATWTP
jgi:6-pyruvoyl-tetrahydropterin synthase